MNSKLAKTLIYALWIPFLSGCQMGYLIKSAYNQISLLNQRVDINTAIEDKNIDENQKKKLALTLKVRDFAEKELGLNVKKNYSTFVKLDRPYVSYVVSAAPKWKLEPYLWSFPIVGKLPYKGYFSEHEASEEATLLKEKDLDVYVRGVSAYSTLGWFNDPLLSSMLSYKEHDLVNTIIHESVHATLFIKSEADFNERLATFIGNKGMELFYQALEGAESPTLALVKQENTDEELFSRFITEELNSLESWYEKLTDKDRNDENRNKKFDLIKLKFKNQIASKLQTDSWKKFSNSQLNNARLLVFKTYMKDLADFEELYLLKKNNIKDFIEESKKLEKVKDPSTKLKIRIKELKNST